MVAGMHGQQAGPGSHLNLPRSRATSTGATGAGTPTPTTEATGAGTISAEDRVWTNLRETLLSILDGEDDPDPLTDSEITSTWSLWLQALDMSPQAGTGSPRSATSDGRYVCRESTSAAAWSMRGGARFLSSAWGRSTAALRNLGPRNWQCRRRRPASAITTNVQQGPLVPLRDAPSSIGSNRPLSLTSSSTQPPPGTCGERVLEDGGPSGDLHDTSDVVGPSYATVPRGSSEISEVRYSVFMRHIMQTVSGVPSEEDRDLLLQHVQRVLRRVLQPGIVNVFDFRQPDAGALAANRQRGQPQQQRQHDQPVVDNHSAYRMAERITPAVVRLRQTVDDQLKKVRCDAPAGGTAASAFTGYGKNSFDNIIAGGGGQGQRQTTSSSTPPRKIQSLFSWETSFAGVLETTSWRLIHTIVALMGFGGRRIPASVDSLVRGWVAKPLLNFRADNDIARLQGLLESALTICTNLYTNTITSFLTDPELQDNLLSFGTLLFQAARRGGQRRNRTRSSSTTSSTIIVIPCSTRSTSVNLNEDGLLGQEEEDQDEEEADEEGLGQEDQDIFSTLFEESILEDLEKGRRGTVLDHLDAPASSTASKALATSTAASEEKAIRINAGFQQILLGSSSLADALENRLQLGDNSWAPVETILTPHYRRPGGAGSCGNSTMQQLPLGRGRSGGLMSPNGGRSLPAHSPLSTTPAGLVSNILFFGAGGSSEDLTTTLLGIAIVLLMMILLCLCCQCCCKCCKKKTENGSDGADDSTSKDTSKQQLLCRNKNNRNTRRNSTGAEVDAGTEDPGDEDDLTQRASQLSRPPQSHSRKNNMQYSCSFPESDGRLYPYSSRGLKNVVAAQRGMNRPRVLQDLDLYGSEDMDEGESALVVSPSSSSSRSDCEQPFTARGLGSANSLLDRRNYTYRCEQYFSRMPREVAGSALTVLGRSSSHGGTGPADEGAQVVVSRGTTTTGTDNSDSIQLMSEQGATMNNLMNSSMMFRRSRRSGNRSRTTSTRMGTSMPLQHDHDNYHKHYRRDEVIEQKYDDHVSLTDDEGEEDASRSCHAADVHSGASVTTTSRSTTAGSSGTAATTSVIVDLVPESTSSCCCTGPSSLTTSQLLKLQLLEAESYDHNGGSSDSDCGEDTLVIQTQGSSTRNPLPERWSPPRQNYSGNFGDADHCEGVEIDVVGNDKDKEAHDQQEDGNNVNQHAKMSGLTLDRSRDSSRSVFTPDASDSLFRHFRPACSENHDNKLEQKTMQTNFRTNKNASNMPRKTHSHSTKTKVGTSASSGRQPHISPLLARVASALRRKVLADDEAGV
ncbi:unnamed protein product [Amoebophrya sp. A25]|nr:unnamed protein product [Amoebophrya sp. A25]|eukprot:GSA25T00010812001.1